MGVPVSIWESLLITKNNIFHHVHAQALHEYSTHVFAGQNTKHPTLDRIDRALQIYPDRDSNLGPYGY